MSTGLKANSDGSAAIQVGGTDVITLTSGGAATFVTSPTTVQAGTAAAPSITFSGDTNTGIYSPGADQVAIATGGTERVRVSSAGVVGVNTTSPAAIGANYGTIDIRGSSGGGFNLGTTGTLTGQIYGNSGGITYDAQGALTHFWYTNSLERMRLTSSGNLLIQQIADDGWVLQTSGSATSIRFNYQRGSYTDIFGFMGHGGDSGGVEFGNINSSVDRSIRFSNGTTYAGRTERARITSGGYFKASDSGAYYSLTGSYHEFRNTSSGNLIAYFTNTGSPTPYGIAVDFSGASPNNTTAYFLSCQDTTNLKLQIYSNGTVTNRTGTYNSFSDLKLKQDIVDASSQWDDIKALRVVKYRLKDEVAADPNYPAYIGLVAQEAEQVSPGLVDDCPDFEVVEVTDEEGNTTTERRATGTVTKAVKYSILYMKAVKALQEAMTRIEQLEAKVAALEGA